MIGGSLALVGASLAGLGATVRALRDGRRPGMASTAAVLATGVYALKVRPWMLRWGATRAQSEATLPGDELAPRPGVGPTRGVTVDAPVEAVWSWLAQIGQDRGGFYSYEWLENLAGLPDAERRTHPPPVADPRGCSRPGRSVDSLGAGGPSRLLLLPAGRAPSCRRLN